MPSRNSTLSSSPRSSDISSSEEQEASGSAVSSQRYENGYTYKNPNTHRQGDYTTTPGYSTLEQKTPDQNTQSGYDNHVYQSPLISYEVPSNYFPGEQFEWPSTYTSGTYGPPHGPTGLVAPFLSSVGHLTSSVKQVQSQLGEQKAKTAYQVADVVKSTGYAVNNAILNKGHAAGQVIGQTIHAAGDALKTKGYTAQKIIANKGHLATSAIQSVGNIGSSLLRSKGELIGAVLKTGSAIGTTALGTASNALAGGTHLIKAKGDAASNLISKGGRLASGVIGTKGRLISSVINAKGQFVAQIVEAKGRAAASLLETSGQKLTQLAEAIKSATQQKGGGGWGWGSNVQAQYSEPEGGNKVIPAEEVVEQVPQINSQQVSHQFQQQGYGGTQDYADSYYDPRDYQRRGRSNRVEDEEENEQRNQRDHGDEEDFQSEYTSYYQPRDYGSPSNHQRFVKYRWE